VRSLRLARIAAEAEGLRLRTQVQRTITRLIMGMVGAVFVFAMLVWVHITVWFWLRVDIGWGQAIAALIITGGDAVLAAFFALLAARSSPGRVEIEALEVRRKALDSAGRSLVFSAGLVPALRLGVDLLRRRRH
jgi:hypothetical protein